jgi:hypothetical protein
MNSFRREWRSCVSDAVIVDQPARIPGSDPRHDAAHGMLEIGHQRSGDQDMGLAAHAIGIFAADIERCSQSGSSPKASPCRSRFHSRNFGETDAFDHGGGAEEILLRRIRGSDRPRRKSGAPQ